MFMNCHKAVGVLVFSITALLSAESSAFSIKTLPRSDNLRVSGDRSARVIDDALLDSFESSDRVTARKAILYSLLMPGLGQHYLGERIKAKTFFIAEGAIWASFIVFRAQKHLRSGSAKDFAVVFAGIDSRDHSDDFFREIGDYDSSDDYELVIKDEGRAYTYPNSNYLTLEDYYMQNRISDFEPWSWRSSQDRNRYYRLRWGSRLANRRSLYCLAAAMANRITSAVFALRSARAYGKNPTSGMNPYHIRFESNPAAYGRTQFALSLTRDF